MSLNARLITDLCLSAGGLGLFLLGINLASTGLRGALGGYLKHLLALLTRNRLLGVFAGAVITLALSSSSAATVLLMGLVDTGLLGIGQALSVLLGSGIGSALTVQIIALDIGAYAGLIVVAGVVGRLFARYRRSRNLCDALVGFGLLFLGLELMNQSAGRLVQTAAWRPYLERVLASPFLGTLAATAFTAVIQSSAATVAFGFVLARSVSEGGAGLSLAGVIPLILGANLGTSATALYAAIGVRAAGRQVALVNFLFKLIGVALAVPLIVPFADLVERFGQTAGMDSPARLVATAHTLFNVALAVLLLPLLSPIAWVLRRLLRRHLRLPGGVLEAVRVEDWENPPTALENAHREILGLGTRARRLFAEVGPAIREDRDRKLDDLVADDDIIDLAQEFLTTYLTPRDAPQLDSDAGEFRRKLLYCLREWETIGDIVSKDLVMLGRKKIDAGLAFTQPMQRDLDELNDLVLESFDATLAFFAKGTRHEADSVLLRETAVDAAQRRVYNQHLDRLAAGIELEAETTSVFVDVTAAVRAVHRHLVDVVRSLSRTPVSTRDLRCDWPPWGAPLDNSAK